MLLQPAADEAVGLDGFDIHVGLAETLEDLFLGVDRVPESIMGAVNIQLDEHASSVEVGPHRVVLPATNDDHLGATAEEASLFVFLGCAAKAGSLRPHACC